MLFTDEFIVSLNEDPIKGTLQICEITFQDLPSEHPRQQKDYEKLIEIYALLTELIESGLLPVNIQSKFSLSGNLYQDCRNILEFVNHVREKCKLLHSQLELQSKRSKLKAALGTTFCYEFSQGDMDRVQSLINQIRDLIASSKNLEEDHQRRLLMRLEKLQSELHKRMPDLDRFWGLIGDAGIVLGKLGTDAKPVVDRVKEIADIVWRTQSRAEELPSGTTPPLLEKDS
ncbi:MAG: hypothetical protein ACXV9R_13880 [Methylobacter sp.]